MALTTKDLAVMVRHGTSLELPLEQQQSYLTPVEQFFVCNSGSSPVIATENYALRIWGDGVECETVLRYADLLSMQQRRVVITGLCFMKWMESVLKHQRAQRN